MKKNINSELYNLKVQTKNKEKKYKKKTDIRWVITIITISFSISFAFSFISETLFPKVALILEIIFLLIFIGIGIIFDMIGVSVTSSSLKPFNSMAARKVRGAKTAVKFKKNADKVSSFCCDVIGDVCGVVSGSASVIIATSLANKMNINQYYIVLIVTACVSALTIGGKAIGKSYAINKSNIILYRVSKLISGFRREK